MLCYAYFHRPGKEQLVQILRRRLFAPNTRGIWKLYGVDGYRSTKHLYFTKVI